MRWIGTATIGCASTFTLPRLDYAPVESVEYALLLARQQHTLHLFQMVEPS
jgi:hypothetical protein